MQTRDSLIEEIDRRFDDEASTALGRAVNGEALNVDRAARWRYLAAELRALADMADQIAETA